MVKYKKELTTPLKAEIAVSAAKLLSPGRRRLREGALNYLSGKYNATKRTIQRVITAFQVRNPDTDVGMDIRRKRKNCGRKSGLTDEIRDIIQAVTQKYADDYLLLTEALLKEELAARGIFRSAGAVHNYLKTMGSEIKTMHVKPSLTHDHKFLRLSFCLNQRDNEHGFAGNNNHHYFLKKFDEVHVGESWFYQRNIDQKLRIVPGTILPNAATVQHKSHIQKVMFLVAMARPRQLEDGSWFDGKIGIWPCVDRAPARRNSRNREAGTLVTSLKTLDANYYRELMTGPGGVFEKVKEKMPWMRGRPLFIQHDGAQPHNGNGNSAYFEEQGVIDGWNIQIVTQPAQSPDLNLLDLGFFASLKTRVSHLKIQANTIDDLIARVETAYHQYDRHTLDSIWAQLFSVYRSVIEVFGENSYDLPHSGNRVDGRQNESSVDLDIDLIVYNAAVNHVNAIRNH